MRDPVPYELLLHILHSLPPALSLQPCELHGPPIFRALHEPYANDWDGSAYADPCDCDDETGARRCPHCAYCRLRGVLGASRALRAAALEAHFGVVQLLAFSSWDSADALEAADRARRFDPPISIDPDLPWLVLYTAYIESLLGRSDLDLASVAVAQLAVAPIVPRRAQLVFPDPDDASFDSPPTLPYPRLARVLLADAAPLVARLAVARAPHVAPSHHRGLRRLALTDSCAAGESAAGVLDAAGVPGQLDSVQVVVVGMVGGWSLVEALLRRCPNLDTLVLADARPWGVMNDGDPEDTPGRLCQREVPGWTGSVRRVVEQRSSPLPVHARLEVVVLDSAPSRGRGNRDEDWSTPLISTDGPVHLVTPALHPAMASFHQYRIDPGDRPAWTRPHKLDDVLTGATVPDDFAVLQPQLCATVRLDGWRSWAGDAAARLGTLLDDLRQRAEEPAKLSSAEVAWLDGEAERVLLEEARQFERDLAETREFSGDW